MPEYRILYSKTSRDQDANLHPEIKTVIRSRIDKLRQEPFSGKRLEKELSGYWSLRARRFRIVYKLNENEPIIEIHHVGHRRDIYELFSEQIGRFPISDEE